MNNNKPFSLHLNADLFLPATDEEKAMQDRMRPQTTFFKDGMKRLFKNKVAFVSLIFVVIVLIAAIFIPLFWPYTYEEQLGVKGGAAVDPSFNNLAPFKYGTTEQELIAKGEKVFPHIFGTDSLGHDYFIRVIYGTRVSLAVGFFASIIVLLIGMIYGSISGYASGRVDLIMMRIIDIIYSIPDMLVIILLSVVLREVFSQDVIQGAIKGTWIETIGTNVISMFIVFGLLYWVSMARLIRGQILSLRQQEYVLAAKSVGAKPGRIIRKHLLPNCISVIVISTALQIPNAIFTESFLSFMGLGVSAPMPSLGSLAADALNGISSYPYRLVIPALFICVIVLSLNLLGDGLRDAFDPKLKN